jgi:hypothetical protein
MALFYFNFRTLASESESEGSVKALGVECPSITSSPLSDSRGATDSAQLLCSTLLSASNVLPASNVLSASTLFSAADATPAEGPRDCSVLSVSPLH